ncbi:hypothetical protein H8D85_00065 [bacterium]|nr:hypothetical protein [bacterium]
MAYNNNIAPSSVILSNTVDNSVAAGSLREMSKELLEKKSPYYLSEQISSLGNAGAVIYIQSLDTTDITQKTNKFYLQGMDISFKERVQIQETFGSPVASFFGSSVKIYTFSGTALEYVSRRKLEHRGEYFNATSLMYLYDNYLRGTKLVKNKQIAVMQVMNHTIWGFPLSMSFQLNSDNDKLVMFNMSFLVQTHELRIPGILSTEDLERNFTTKSDRDLSKHLEALKNCHKTVFELESYMVKVWGKIGTKQASSKDKDTYTTDYDDKISGYKAAAIELINNSSDSTSVSQILGFETD